MFDSIFAGLMHLIGNGSFLARLGWGILYGAGGGMAIGALVGVALAVVAPTYFAGRGGNEKPPNNPAQNTPPPAPAGSATTGPIVQSGAGNTLNVNTFNVIFDKPQNSEQLHQKETVDEILKQNTDVKSAKLDERFKQAAPAVNAELEKRGEKFRIDGDTGLVQAADKAVQDYRQRSTLIAADRIKAELKAICEAVAQPFNLPNWSPQYSMTRMVTANEGDMAYAPLSDKLPGSIWVAVRVLTDFETPVDRNILASYVMLGRISPTENQIGVWDEKNNWTPTIRTASTDPNQTNLIKALVKQELDRLTSIQTEYVKRKR